jgi:hypothetical protein
MLGAVGDHVVASRVTTADGLGMDGRSRAAADSLNAWPGGSYESSTCLLKAPLFSTFSSHLV